MPTSDMRRRAFVSDLARFDVVGSSGGPGHGRGAGEGAKTVRGREPVRVVADFGQHPRRQDWPKAGSRREDRRERVGVERTCECSLVRLHGAPHRFDDLDEAGDG